MTTDQFFYYVNNPAELQKLPDTPETVELLQQMNEKAEEVKSKIKVALERSGNKTG